jgi:hypothetical protein
LGEGRYVRHRNEETQEHSQEWLCPRKAEESTVIWAARLSP